MVDVLRDYGNFKTTGGYFRTARVLLKIHGPDGRDFLHRLTSQDIKGLLTGHGRPAAFLRPDSTIVSLFTVYALKDFFLLAGSGENSHDLHAELTRFHFAEDLQIKDVSREYDFFSVQGGDVRERVKGFFKGQPSELHEITSVTAGGSSFLVASEGDFAAPGFHFIVEPAVSPSIEAKLRDAGLEPLSLELWNILRLESGHFQMGRDINEKNLILEAPLADSVSRNKGCFPGQEVIERIFSYSQISKRLVALHLNEIPKPSAPIFSGGKRIGIIKFAAQIPWSSQTLALAMVQKPYYSEGQEVQVEGFHELSRVILLPNTFEMNK